MPPVIPAGETRLEQLLLTKIIPWVQEYGMQQVFVAAGSWQELRENSSHLPKGTFTTYKPLLGKRTRPRINRSYGRLSIEQNRWPQDHLLSARTPKLCFVIEGPVAFQIADYVLHCDPGHSILLPAGTPNPDGTLPVLDKERPHHDTCELLMMMPYQGSLNYWSIRQNYAANGEMSRHSNTLPILQSAVAPYLHQLVDEATRRQLHWEDICNGLLYNLTLLLHRELSGRPLIRSGDESGEELFEPSQPKAHAIAKAEEYIRANLRHPLTLDGVAHTVFLSRTTFIRQFRTRTGKSFIQYVNDCRFEEACHQLQNGNLSVAQISRYVGLHPSSLRLLIRERTGISPLALRQRSRCERKE